MKFSDELSSRRQTQTRMLAQRMNTQHITLCYAGCAMSVSRGTYSESVTTWGLAAD